MIEIGEVPICPFMVDTSTEEYCFCHDGIPYYNPFLPITGRGDDEKITYFKCRAWTDHCGKSDCKYFIDSSCPANCEFGKPHCRRLE